MGLNKSFTNPITQVSQQINFVVNAAAGAQRVLDVSKRQVVHVLGEGAVSFAPDPVLAQVHAFLLYTSLEQFEKEVGYKFRPEYIIDQGYMNNT